MDPKRPMTPTDDDFRAAALAGDGHREAARRLGVTEWTARKAYERLGLEGRMGRKGGPKARGTRLSVWLSPEDVERLRAAAGGVRLATFARERLMRALEERTAEQERADTVAYLQRFHLHTAAEDVRLGLHLKGGTP